MLVYILATILFIPGSLLTLGAGWAFSKAFDNRSVAILTGSVTVFAGAFFGSLCAFFIGRYIFRGTVTRLSAKMPLFEALDKALEQDGLKLTFLLRLSALMPYCLFNYLMGLTAISLIDYMMASVGMVPGILVYVFIGTTITDL